MIEFRDRVLVRSAGVSTTACQCFTVGGGKNPDADQSGRRRVTMVPLEELAEVRVRDVGQEVLLVEPRGAAEVVDVVWLAQVPVPVVCLVQLLVEGLVVAAGVPTLDVRWELLAS